MATISEQIVVVGGGVAGCSAALEAVRLGLRVTLVDEHPQSISAMSLDAPYFYGARLASVLSDEGTIADRVLGSNDLLMECLEAGVEVLPNTCVWGVFIPGANNEHLEDRQVGLADNERSWMVSFDYLIIAAGARDLVLSFPGWHLPGVLGAKAASALIGRYKALGGNKMLILGSANAALHLALQAIEVGIQVVGIVEAQSTIQGDDALEQQLLAHQVPFHLGYTIAQALGTNEVSGAQLVNALDASLDSFNVPCDTICMAFDVVPNVELASVAGCELVFDERHHGWAPAVNEQMESNVERVFVIGDAAGVSEASLIDPGVAAFQGRVAARQIALRETIDVAIESQPSSPATTSSSTYPPTAWLDSLVRAGGEEVIVCQCEDVTRRELTEVRPPKYLNAPKGSPSQALQNMLVEGLASQDTLKRMTRVGMGHCQGKRCRDQSSMLVADAAKVDLCRVVTGSYRIPVRPLPLTVMWADDESSELRDRWPTWLHPVDDALPGAH